MWQYIKVNVAPLSTSIQHLKASNFLYSERMAVPLGGEPLRRPAKRETCRARS